VQDDVEENGRRGGSKIFSENREVMLQLVRVKEILIDFCYSD